MTQGCHHPALCSANHHPPGTALSYLVVTHLDFTDALAGERAAAERELATLGLLRCVVDSRAEAHVLPKDTYAGVFDGAEAHGIRTRVGEALKGVIGPEARVFVCIGRHWSLRHAA